MSSALKITRFGNKILRSSAKRLSAKQIKSKEVQDLIDQMQRLLDGKKYGVGLAAPQVGYDVAISVISIKSTPTRPNLEPFNEVIINPEVVATHGNKQQMWEGCISSGNGNNTLYAKVPRYKRVTLRWLDKDASVHEEVLDGFVAHVAQHETDHLNGILFVDRVKDTSTYMLADEYKKYQKSIRSKS